MFGQKKNTEVAPAAGERQGFVQRLKQRLGKTRAGLTDKLAGILGRGGGIDESLLEEIEDQLLMADVGVEAGSGIIDRLREQLKKGSLPDSEAVYAVIRQAMLDILAPCERALAISAAEKGPFVILVVGVNGAGKTTTIGKIAHHLRQQGRSVMLAAGDTFRAAAIEQLQAWGERNEVPVVAQHQGADSASVVFDAVQSAQARGIDVLIADTAGRLHTQSNLMEEIKKIHRVIGKIDPAMPHETLLVLDAGTGQNALAQADQFHRAIGLTGVAVTKLDGTAKGGVVIALAEKLRLPIRYIGIGEQAEDLRPFLAAPFVDALLEKQ